MNKKLITLFVKEIQEMLYDLKADDATFNQFDEAVERYIGNDIKY